MKPSWLPALMLSTLNTVVAPLAVPLAVPIGAALLTPLSASAQAATAQAPTALPAGMTQVTSVEGITEYRLANGLQVLLVPDDSKPTTTVNVTYRVGSRNENYGETGMAHLLEHLLFKGTPTNKNVWAEFSKRGMRANGSTWYDRTNYFASFSANDANLQWYLAWQADAMVNSFIARSDLDTEMTVVRNEFESGENRPSSVLLQKTLATMYEWHAYGKNTIGARSDIENVDIPRLQAFYRQYYQPDNATLIISGKFDAARTLAWVAQSFGAIAKPTRVLHPTYTLDPPQDGERTVTVKRVGGTPLLLMAYHMPAGASADSAVAQLLGSVLADPPGGRLHKRLVERQLASSSFSWVFALAEPGPLIAGLNLAPGQSVETARAEMAKVLDGVLAEPITSEELERARIGWLNAWDAGFTNPETVGVELSESIANGDWRLYFIKRDQVRKVTLADMQRVASTWLVPDNRTVGVYLPTTAPKRAPQAERVDVAALVKDYKGDPTVAQAEVFDVSPANLDARTQLSQLGSDARTGMKLALLPKTTRGRVVQARLRLHYGDEKTLFGQETVASFAASLLDKGGAGMTRQQIADAFDKLQAEVGFFASDQTLVASISTKREHLPEVIALVGKLLRQPAFEQSALDELQRQQLAAIERGRKEPDAIINNLVARHGNPYPRGDLRYASTFDEAEQDVKAVTPQALRSFHQRFYAASGSEFAAVGDFDPAATRQALQLALGDWRDPAAAKANFVRVPRPLVAVPAVRFFERTPDKANANLRVALSVPLSDRDADYPALSLANYIFGGGGNGRLWKRVREREGLSYGVYSGLDWTSLDQNSRWSASAIFAPQNQAKVEAALQDELARALKDGFTQDEVDEGRAALLNFRRLSRAQDGGLANQWVSNLYLGRTFAYAQQIDDAIAKLTTEQVNAAWRKYITQQSMVTAWGGDFK